MQRSTRQLLQFVVFLGLAVVFTWLAFAGQDLNALREMLGETRWAYVGLALVLTLLGHWARAARWQLLLRNAGMPVKLSHALVSLLNGYFVNLGVPRLGEITRCGVLNRLSGTPVLTAAGTVVAERAVDVLVLVLIALGFFLTAGGKFLAAGEELVLQPVVEFLSGKIGWLVLLGGLGLLGLGILFLWARGRKRDAGKSLLNRSREWAAQLYGGLVSALRLPGFGRFALLTLAIWVSYYSAPLLSLLALDLGHPELLTVAFAAFLFGSLARTVPLPAGSVGAYHYLVSSVLLLWGYSESEGLGLATLNHGVQTLFYLLAGLGSWIALVVLQQRALAPEK
ncbi:MAG: lysylphosphatidylglycerol synthase transmembrane domain-containing protein [Bacteroidota bacterium]